MKPMEQRQQDRPELDVHPASESGAVPAPRGSAWKGPAIAGAAAFLGVRLLRVGLAGKLLRVGLKLGRGPAGKLALSFAAKKLADRKRR
jgi:hypothetical protein